MSDTIIRLYYALFNERRFGEAADLHTEDALVEHPPFGQRRFGGEGYLRFAEMWTSAFPDANVAIDRVEQRGDTICEVDLIGAGTHLGDLDMGAFGLVKATGMRVSFRLRQLFEIRVGKITFSSLTFDVHDLVQQLQPAAGDPSRPSKASGA